MTNKIHWVASKAGAVHKAYDTAGAMLGYLQLQKNHPLGPTFDVVQIIKGDFKRLGSCGGGERDDAAQRGRELLEAACSKGGR